MRENLDERITKQFDSLSPKQKRLARFALDNKYFLSFSAANQTAKKTGTSAATVVRFAQALGYGGFSEMQAALRDELPSYLTAVERMQARLARSRSEMENPNKIFATDIRNIQRTAGNLQTEKLQEAAREIVQADEIIIVGAGLSAGSALFLAHSLKVIGFNARWILDGGLPLAVELAHLRSGTVLIAIALWRYFRTTIDAVSKANQAGIKTIAITDSILSPLSEKAGYAFEIATESIDHSLSPTAVISFVNVLVSMVSNIAPDRVLSALRRVDAAYREGDLLVVGNQERG